MSQTACPKCQFTSPAPTDICPRCGLVFAKWTGPRKTSREIIVTTGDLPHGSYEVLRPVYFSVSNRNKMLDQIAARFGIAMDGSATPDLLSVLSSTATLHWTAFPAAFDACVEGLRRACLALGGDAVVSMKQDVDIDHGSSGVPFFYMQAYGTAVKFKESRV